MSYDSFYQLSRKPQLSVNLSILCSSDYDNLREHFRVDHYLCEEGDCAHVQFTNAFRSDIDLQSHRAQIHSKAQSKSQSRQERTLNIDINLVPRQTTRGNLDMCKSHNV